MKRKMGFTLVEIMIVVAIIGLLAAIAIPSFMKARESSQQNSCKENLRQIEGAKESWAMKTGHNQGDPIVTLEVTGYLKDQVFPTCPGGGNYTIGNVGTQASCSILTPNHNLP